LESQNKRDAGDGLQPRLIPGIICRGTDWEEMMARIALVVGGLLTVVGIVGVIVRLFPPNDGALAIAGAVIFAAGVLKYSKSSAAR
jgi:hypothetical protein